MLRTPLDLAGFEARTERLLLRPYRDEDFLRMAQAQSDPDVARYLPYDPRDDAQARTAFERAGHLVLAEEGDRVTLAGVDRATGQYVGEWLLFLRSVAHRGGELGYVLHPDQHGRGLAVEGATVMLRIGFDLLGLHRIVARLDARNTPSAKVLAKLGMRREAHFVSNEWVKGEWTDEVVYALLEDEWAGQDGR